MSRQPEEPRGGSAGREPTDDEVDRRFLELTAGLGAESLVGDDGPTDDPDASHEPDLRAEPAEPSTAGAVEPSPPSRPAAGGPRDYSLVDEPDEAFVPPEPEPLSTAEPLLVVAWLGAAGGPLVFLVLVLLWPAAPALVWWTTLVATLAGWGLVVWRLPRTRDGGGDDGAVV